MTLKEKIQSIDPDKTKSPVKVREFINKIEETANTSETKALALIDGLIAKLTLENPNAIKSVTLTTEQAKRKLSKLKTLKAIVPKKADLQQIENQIRKQYPNWDNDKVSKLAQLRIDAQISRSESFNKLIDTLGASQFYGAKELSTAQIDKGRSRSLEKDSKQGSITEADELKMQKKGVKPAKYKRISKAGAKNQYGTTKGGKVYYEYRMNRRDVDNKIRLEKGGGVGSVIVGSYRTKAEAEKMRAIFQNAKSTKKNEFFYIEKIHNPKSELEYNLIKETSGFANGGGVGIPNSDKMFHLPMEIAVYVPSTKNVSENITASELRSRVKEVEKYLAETFGGFTSSEKVGGYLSNKSSVVTEKVVPVTAFATKDAFEKNKSKLVSKLSVWAKKWSQEAMGLEFEGDLYYVPQKFKVGGTLKATYIPRADIKMLTTVWGNNIKGKDLLDGAYTKRKNIKTQPKMVRSIFEEEEFSEFKKGGNIMNNLSKLRAGKPKAGSKLLFDLKYGDVYQIIKDQHTETGGYFFFIDLDDKYGISLKSKDFHDIIKGTRGSDKYVSGVQDGDIRILSREEAGAMMLNYKLNNNLFKKGGTTKPKEPTIVRGFFDDEAYEYDNGGRAGVPNFNFLPKTPIYPHWVDVDNLITDNTKYGLVSNLSNDIIFERMINTLDPENNEYDNLSIYKREYEKRKDWYSSNFGRNFLDISDSRTVKNTAFQKGGKTNNLKIKKFATGSRISSDDTPKIWVGEWSLYNEGNLTGEWVDLSDFEDGAEVMDKIQALLDKWTKSTGELREEYAIFDFENFPRELYSEQMGEAQFDKIITAYKLSESLDIPMDVLASLMSEYDLDDANALEEFVNERYVGYFQNNSDLGEHLVEMYGGIENMPKHTLEMYFDYDSYGRDEDINSFNAYEGYYFYNN